MQKGIIFLITAYQSIFSPETGVLARQQAPVCAFYPSCSEYAKRATKKHGVIKGGLRAFSRIARCRPGREYTVEMP